MPPSSPPRGGGVAVRTLVAGDEAVVEDTGSGRWGDTLTGKPGGAGLGLPISREIVQHHGGRLSATSVPGRGSCFRMTLPLAHARE